MARGFELDQQWQFAAPDRGQQFLAGLNRAFGPAMLLRFEAVHIDGQLGGRHHVRQENKFPARELRAVAQIEIFGQRVVLPASGFLDAGTPPQTGRPVEIKKSPAPAARCLFEQKMTIEEHRLHAGQQRIAAVQMTPARLNHSDFRVGKKMNGAPQQIGRRNKIRIENANKFTC